MDCHNLVQCSITSVTQHSHDVEVGLDFVRAVQECIADLEIPWHVVVNMGQTAVNFENFGNCTIDVHSAHQGLVQDSDNHLGHVTVCLAVALDGTKLPPYVYIVFIKEADHTSVKLLFPRRTPQVLPIPTLHLAVAGARHILGGFKFTTICHMLFSRELLMAILLMKFVHRTLAMTHAASMMFKLMSSVTR